jgi:hypothetical protein
VCGWVCDAGVVPHGVRVEGCATFTQRAPELVDRRPLVAQRSEDVVWRHMLLTLRQLDELLLLLNGVPSHVITRRRRDVLVLL